MPFRTASIFDLKVRMVNVSILGTRFWGGLVVLTAAFAACASPTTDSVAANPGAGGTSNSSGGTSALAGAPANNGGSTPLAFGGGNNGASGSSSIAGSVGVSGAAGANFGGNAGTSSSGGSGTGGHGGSAGNSGGSGGSTAVAGAGGSAAGSAGSAGSASAGSGGSTGGGPCANPVDVANGNSGGFKTTGAVCLRTTEDFTTLGCSNMDGRTIKVNGVTAACGNGPFAPKIGGYNYFDISAGTNDYASIYWFTS